MGHDLSRLSGRLGRILRITRASDTPGSPEQILTEQVSAKVVVCPLSDIRALMGKKLRISLGSDLAPETWTLRKLERKYLESIEMWC